MRCSAVFLAIGIHLVTGGTPASLTADGPMTQPRPTPVFTPAARAWVDARGGLLEHHPATTRLQRIVDELAQAAGLQPVSLWIVDHAAPAAASAPPNDVFLNRGLVALLPEDELATVIAHELAHLAERHDAGVFQLLDEHHGSLHEEARADAVGLLILHRAGYDKQAMVAAMTRVRDHMGVKDPAWGVLNQRLIVLRQTVVTLFPAPAEAPPRG